MLSAKRCAAGAQVVAVASVFAERGVPLVVDELDGAYDANNPRHAEMLALMLGSFGAPS